MQSYSIEFHLRLESTVPRSTLIYLIIIAGNGPSGIALSYMLDGNIPFYNQEEHPDEMLTARLRYVSPTESLIEQDLSYLSAGLEGRSTNPISLLVDALEHPNADFGLQHKSLLEWRNQPGKEVKKKPSQFI